MWTGLLQGYITLYRESLYDSLCMVWFITDLHHAFSVTVSRCIASLCMGLFITGLHHALSVTVSRCNNVAV